MASIRIVNIDYYSNQPIPNLDVLNSEFRGSSIHKVPIIRIFGSTKTGEKTCLHIHGVFPYIYIPFEGHDDPNSVAYQLASALDKSINISMGQTSSNQQHIFKIILVAAIPFYGYHARDHQFMKIYFYNPLIMKKAFTLLQNGAILGKIYQPHESHIAYIQQFMIDYNLHGMSFINLSEITYRYDETNPDATPADLTLRIKRMSTSKLEMDALAENIINRLEISSGEIVLNPGIQYIRDDEMQRRRNKGLDTQLETILTQNRTEINPTSTHIKFQVALTEKLKKKIDITSDNPNASVYPAETPEDESFISASSILDHSQINLDATNFDLDPLALLDASILDEDANLLFDLLKDNEELEEDSILSQVPKVDEDNDEDDLSAPLASITTPQKNDPNPEKINSDDDIWNDSFFDKTLVDLKHDISQLDGPMDDEVAVNTRRSARIQNLVTKRRSILKNLLIDPSRVSSKKIILTEKQEDLKITPQNITINVVTPTKSKETTPMKKVYNIPKLNKVSKVSPEMTKVKKSTSEKLINITPHNTTINVINTRNSDKTSPMSNVAKISPQQNKVSKISQQKTSEEHKNLNITPKNTKINITPQKKRASKTTPPITHVPNINQDNHYILKKAEKNVLLPKKILHKVPKSKPKIEILKTPQQTVPKTSHDATSSKDKIVNVPLKKTGYKSKKINSNQIEIKTIGTLKEFINKPNLLNSMNLRNTPERKLSAIKLKQSNELKDKYNYLKFRGIPKYTELVERVENCMVLKSKHPKIESIICKPETIKSKTITPYTITNWKNIEPVTKKVGRPKIIGNNVTDQVKTPINTKISKKNEAILKAFTGVTNKPVTRNATKMLTNTSKIVEPQRKTTDIVEPQAKTPNNVEPQAKTPNIVEPQAKTPNIVEPQAKTLNNVEPLAKIPNIVEPQAKTPNNVEPLAKIPNIVEPLAKTPNIVELQGKVTNIVELQAITPNIVELQVNTPNIIELQAKTTNIVEHQAITPNIVEFQAKTLNIVKHQAKTPNIVELQAKTPNTVQALTRNIVELQVITPNIVERQAKTTNIVEYQAETPYIVELQAKTPNIVKLQAITPNIVKFQARTLNIVEHQALTPNIVELQAKTTNIDEHQAKTPCIVELQAKTHNIVELQAKTTNIVEFQAKTLNIVKHQAKTPNIVELQAKTPNTVQALTRNIVELQVITPNIVERQAKTTNIVEYQAETPYIVELQAKTPNIVKLQAITPNIVKFQAKTLNIVEHQALTPNIVELQAKTTNIDEHQAKTPCIVELQAKTHNIVELQAKIPNIVKLQAITPNIIERQPKTPNIVDTIIPNKCNDEGNETIKNPTQNKSEFENGDNLTKKGILYSQLCGLLAKECKNHPINNFEITNPVDDKDLNPNFKENNLQNETYVEPENTLVTIEDETHLENGLDCTVVPNKFKYNSGITNQRNKKSANASVLKKMVLRAPKMVTKPKTQCLCSKNDKNHTLNKNTKAKMYTNPCYVKMIKCCKTQQSIDNYFIKKSGDGDTKLCKENTSSTDILTNVDNSLNGFETENKELDPVVECPLYSIRSPIMKLKSPNSLRSSIQSPTQNNFALNLTSPNHNLGDNRLTERRMSSPFNTLSSPTSTSVALNTFNLENKGQQNCETNLENCCTKKIPFNVQNRDFQTIQNPFDMKTSKVFVGKIQPNLARKPIQKDYGRQCFEELQIVPNIEPLDLSKNAFTQIENNAIGFTNKIPFATFDREFSEAQKICYYKKLDELKKAKVEQEMLKGVTHEYRCNYNVMRNVKKERLNKDLHKPLRKSANKQIKAIYVIPNLFRTACVKDEPKITEKSNASRVVERKLYKIKLLTKKQANDHDKVLADDLMAKYIDQAMAIGVKPKFNVITSTQVNHAKRLEYGERLNNDLKIKSFYKTTSNASETSNVLGDLVKVTPESKRIRILSNHKLKDNEKVKAQNAAKLMENKHLEIADELLNIYQEIEDACAINAKTRDILQDPLPDLEHSITFDDLIGDLNEDLISPYDLINDVLNTPEIVMKQRNISSPSLIEVKPRDNIKEVDDSQNNNFLNYCHTDGLQLCGISQLSTPEMNVKPRKIIESNKTQIGQNEANIFEDLNKINAICDLDKDLYTQNTKVFESDTSQVINFVGDKESLDITNLDWDESISNSDASENANNVEKKHEWNLTEEQINSINNLSRDCMKQFRRLMKKQEKLEIRHQKIMKKCIVNSNVNGALMLRNIKRKAKRKSLTDLSLHPNKIRHTGDTFNCLGTIHEDPKRFENVAIQPKQDSESISNYCYSDYSTDARVDINKHKSNQIFSSTPQHLKPADKIDVTNISPVTCNALNPSKSTNKSNTCKMNTSWDDLLTSNDEQSFYNEINKPILNNETKQKPKSKRVYVSRWDKPKLMRLDDLNNNSSREINSSLQERESVCISSFSDEYFSQLDGANDDSSTDDEDKGNKNKRTRVVNKRIRISGVVGSPRKKIQYPSLAIQVQSPKKNFRTVDTDSKTFPSFSLTEKTTEETNIKQNNPDCDNKTIINVSETPCDKILPEKVKRKLDFVDLNLKTLDSTIIQENIMCRLTPSKTCSYNISSSKNKISKYVNQSINVSSKPLNISNQLIISKTQHLSQQSSSIIDTHAIHQNTSKCDTISSQQSTSKCDTISSQQSTSKRDAISTQQSTSKCDAISSQQSTSKCDAISRQQSTLKCDAISSQQSTSKCDAISSQQSTSKCDAISRQQSTSKCDAISSQPSTSNRDAISSQQSTSKCNTILSQQSTSKCDTILSQQSTSKCETISSKRINSKSEKNSLQQSTSKFETTSSKHNINLLQTSKQINVSKSSSLELSDLNLSDNLPQKQLVSQKINVPQEISDFSELSLNLSDINTNISNEIRNMSQSSHTSNNSYNSDDLFSPDETTLIEPDININEPNINIYEPNININEPNININEPNININKPNINIIEPNFDINESNINIIEPNININEPNIRVVEQKLTTVEQYDYQKQILPQAGPSRLSETCVSVDLNLQLSLSPKESGSSTDFSITPYQTEQPQTISQDSVKLTNYNFETQFNPQNLSINEEMQTLIEKTSDGCNVLMPKCNPPTRDWIESTMHMYNIPQVRNQSPFYSDLNDVTGNVEVGPNVLKIASKTVADLTEFDSGFVGILEKQKAQIRQIHPHFNNKEFVNMKLSHCVNADCVLEPIIKAPTRKSVELWIKAKALRQEIVEVNKIDKIKILIPSSPGFDTSCDETLTLSPCSPPNNNVSPVLAKSSHKHKRKSSVAKSLTEKFEQIQDPNKSDDSLRKMLLQSHLFDKSDSIMNMSGVITGASLNNTHGFKNTLENLQKIRCVSEYQYLTTLIIELHIQTRGDFKPNPEFDAIQAIFYSILNDVPEDYHQARNETGAFVVNNQLLSPTKSKNKVDVLVGSGVNCDNITYVDAEIDLIPKFVDFLKRWDPDIVLGYEIEMLSWGYLIERCYTLGINLIPQLSRIVDIPQRRKEQEQELHTELKIPGRIVLDLWRLMRHEMALLNYTFENVVYHILHERVPKHSFKDLTNWWVHKAPKMRHLTANYYIYRVKASLRLMDQLDFIGRTSELARLFGILFYEVLSRGSQFRVESMMLRLAKPQNYIPVSPNTNQRARMRAPEYLPLILEPESKFYKDPVIVLDFQSLYPSIIIAYNYCFSTCIGRVEHLGTNNSFEFGATQFKISKARVQQLLKRNQLNFSPCGVGFVNKKVRLGIMPRMLQEILDTRLLVKKAMKDDRDNKLLQRVLHSRQLGLKLIANVTYGYTAANFSGRMPAVELGDSVVAKGRETLQRAINLVELNETWGAKVVYGDTDSLFVLVGGRSREDAFKIGAEIAEAVTNANPSPVRLKLEKVYQPCILQTKKRYVGYMYESCGQKEPDFDAKGIETVRRDGCPAVSKMLEKCIKLLFEVRDVSLIRKYVLRQFNKVLAGRVSIQDLTLAKEYRGSEGYKPGACVPALELSRKWKIVDKRNEPRSGERVPYVVVHGPPGLPLIRLVRSPAELLADPALRPNALYYITKVIIPPLNRCFKLIGCDMNIWFNEMPRKQTQYLPTSSPTKGRKTTIAQYFATTSCASCGQQTKTGLCENCQKNPQTSCIILHEKVREWERNYNETNKICQICCNRQTKINCISLDCPVLYRMTQTIRDCQQSSYVRDIINNLPELEF